MAMVFWIFSYNRGEFLHNCVTSIELCAPDSTIRIFDDNSTDADTRKILGELSQRHSVYYPQPQTDDGNKHGGLYANMQAAFEYCDADDLVCFLQDDTQLVRKVAPQEFLELKEYFANSKAGFVHPAFMRWRNKKSDQSRTRFDAEKNVYFVDRLQSSAGAFFSDICIFHTQKLRDAQWRFIPRESRNEQVARRTLQQMAYWRNPFLAWLPNAPAFRGKIQTFALRHAQKIRPCGFFPIHILSDEENQRFVTRDPHRLPYAEEFLKTSVDLPKPWIYYPLQGKSGLKHLNNIELKIRRWLGL